MKTLIATIMTAGLLLSGATVAFAGAGNYTSSGYGVPCTPSYGNDCNQPGVVSINKMVLSPDSTSTTKGGQPVETYVENLGQNDPHYAPDQAAAFKLVVTNTGTKDLTNVVVHDYFPNYITFVSGDGTFSNGTDTITIPSLKAGESKTLIIRAKIASADQLPSNQTVTCVVNKADVTADNKTAQDNAQFCIENKVPGAQPSLPVYPAPNQKTTPPTGPEALALFSLIPGAISGLLLRKKAVRN